MYIGLSQVGLRLNNDVCENSDESQGFIKAENTTID
jgi:hypothetical protein